MCLLVAGIFLMLWLMQTVFIKAFYDRMAIAELKKCADEISSVYHEAGKPLSYADAGKASSDAGAGKASVYPDEELYTYIDTAAGENAYMIFVTDMDGSILYHSDEYSSFYSSENSREGNEGESREDNPAADNAVGNPYRHGTEGKLSWQIGAERNLPDGFETLRLQLIDDADAKSAEMTSEDGKTFLYACIIGSKTDETGAPAGILSINMPLGAVGSTVKILKLQLLCAFAIALVLALIVSLWLSDNLSGPVKKISKEAEKLALEQFDLEVPEGFCIETDELGHSLKNAAASLATAKRSQQELLANISHDLRTPLTMMKGYAEMLRDISWENEAEREHDLGVIISETDRLSGLVNEILEYSHLKEDNAPVHAEAFDLAEAYAGVAEQFKALLDKNSISLNINADKDTYAAGVRSDIIRVMYNFTDNAIQHSKENSSIEVTVSKAENAAYFSIANIGTPLNEDTLPYIWERYYTSRSRKNTETVSGLGLAISKEILLHHNAEYGIKTEPAGDLQKISFWFKLKKTGETEK